MEPETHPSLTQSRWKPGLAHLISLAIFGATAIIIRLEGQPWWCECGKLWLWVSDIWSSHCSQHLLDPYSITHVAHGMILWGALAFLPKRVRPRPDWQFCIAIALEAAWEVLENSPFVINRYRQQTMALDYLGDSVVNALGDIVACALGFVLARKLGLRWTIVLFIVMELVLLFWIRDNLTLNVLMLILPIEAIKNWQTVGHAP